MRRQVTISGQRLMPALGLLFGLLSVAIGAEPIDYRGQIKPIFRTACYSCHGGLKQESGLRLDTAALMRKGGDGGPGIVPQSPSESSLFRRITAQDIDERMPPEHLGEPLTAEQVDLIRQWIESGALAPADEQPEDDPRDHWSFQPVRRPAVPQTEFSSAVNPIDSFLEYRRREHQVEAAPEAPRLLLIRRLYMDLVGMPAEPSVVEELQNDPSPDWYDRAVDRLLADPRYAERWARHWMDIWRYSDWWGLGDQHRFSQKHIWHWRDWIIESLNEDLAYDEMVRLMLAADELAPDDPDKLRATGYLARNFILFNRTQWMDETIEHVSKGLLGITMNCAKCHDHKFDPVDQTDYYRFRAIFEPYQARMDMIAGEVNLERDGIPRVYDSDLDIPTYLFVRGDEKNPDQSQVIAPGIPSVWGGDEFKVEPVVLPDESWQPARRTGILDTYLSNAQDRLHQAELERDKIFSEFPISKAIAEGDSTDETNPSEESKADLAVAERTRADAKVAVAQAERKSVTARAAAMRAGWATSSGNEREFAIQAERDVGVAKSRLAIAEAEYKLLAAEPKDAEAAQKSLDSARADLDKAMIASATSIEPTETFTSLPGAMWIATRFLDSTTDDASREFPPTSTGRRSGLAKWITDPTNPLTRRVAVNHIWARHLGQPLVPTVFDFGRNGTPSDLPELVDWLASEWLEQKWSMKDLHRLMVTSAAYRMDSRLPTGAAAHVDPENRWWGRRLPTRIEAEAVRDSLLMLSGRLDGMIGGPPVVPAEQDDSRRRSMYFFHSNNERHRFLTTFDAPSVRDCYRREQSIVPQQALALTNSRMTLDSCRAIAERLSDDADGDSSFIRLAFRVMLGIDPNDDEMNSCLDALNEWQARSLEPVAAREQLIWALVNHNDFVTLR